MSEAFDSFLKQYRATGREKLDGYSLVNIDQLEPDEKTQAIELLEQEVAHFYGAIEPLAHLDSARTVTLLKKIEDTKPKDIIRQSYQVFYWLWKLTEDEAYAAKLVACRRHLTGPDINTFYTTMTWAITSPVIEDALRQAVFDEPESVARGIAAGAILDKCGITFDGDTREQHRSMWKILKSGTVDEKQAVMSKL